MLMVLEDTLSVPLFASHVPPNLRSSAMTSPKYCGSERETLSADKVTDSQNHLGLDPFEP